MHGARVLTCRQAADRLPVQDFVGTDMARKFLQMGMTRAQRYANHKGGRKRDKDGQDIPLSHDPVKAECAQIFREKWEQVSLLLRVLLC